MRSPESQLSGGEMPRNGRMLLVGYFLILALAGAWIATLPHLVDLFRGTPPTYLADTDQLLYMGWSRAIVLEGVWYLVDAVHHGRSPMMHPWALFVPVGQLARATHIGPVGLAIIWRLIGGVGIALGLFVALRPSLKSGQLAFALALILLFDAGLLFGQPLIRSALVGRSILQGRPNFYSGPPQVLAHLRVVPPALVLPVLLLAFGLITRARRHLSLGSSIAAGVALGGLFHLYFYFWTIVVGGLLIALILDPGGRRTFAIVLGVGLLLGFPAVILNAQIKAATPPDWLYRTEKFVPVGHFRELLIPKLLVMGWLISSAFVFRRRHDLIWLWCTVGAGLACTNHQVLSGLQIENFHWLLGTGTGLSVLLADLFGSMAFENGERLTRRGWLLALVCVQIVCGSALRFDEVRNTSESNKLYACYSSVRDILATIPPGSVVAGEPDAVMIAAATREVYPLSGRFTEFSARITDREFDERLMLNLFLLGQDRAAGVRAAEAPPGTLSWESLAVHSAEAAARQRARRLALVDEIWTDPDRTIERYHVSHVLLPAQAPSLTDRIQTSTKLSVRTEDWLLWEVQADRPASPAAETPSLPPHRGE